MQLENGTVDPRDSDPSTSSSSPELKGQVFQINYICKDEEIRTTKG